jgi:hypothetical protein
MKISVQEAFTLAKEKLPAGANVELTFHTEDHMNNRIIYALAKESGMPKASIWLVSFGMAKNFEEAKKRVEKAQKSFDNLPSSD